jgi:hypothetical protein
MGHPNSQEGSPTPAKITLTSKHHVILSPRQNTAPIVNLRWNCHNTRGILKIRPRRGIIHVVKYRPGRTRGHNAKAHPATQPISAPPSPEGDPRVGHPPPHRHQGHNTSVIHASLLCGDLRHNHKPTHVGTTPPPCTPRGRTARPSHPT